MDSSQGFFPPSDSVYLQWFRLETALIQHLGDNNQKHCVQVHVKTLVSKRDCSSFIAFELCEDSFSGVWILYDFFFSLSRHSFDIRQSWWHPPDTELLQSDVRGNHKSGLLCCLSPHQASQVGQWRIQTLDLEHRLLNLNFFGRLSVCSTLHFPILIQCECTCWRIRDTAYVFCGPATTAEWSNGTLLIYLPFSCV